MHILCVYRHNIGITLAVSSKQKSNRGSPLDLFIHMLVLAIGIDYPFQIFPKFIAILKYLRSVVLYLIHFTPISLKNSHIVYGIF